MSREGRALAFFLVAVLGGSAVASAPAAASTDAAPGPFAEGPAREWALYRVDRSSDDEWIRDGWLAFLPLETAWMQDTHGVPRLVDHFVLQHGHERGGSTSGLTWWQAHLHGNGSLLSITHHQAEVSSNASFITREYRPEASPVQPFCGLSWVVEGRTEQGDAILRLPACPGAGGFRPLGTAKDAPDVTVWQNAAGDEVWTDPSIEYPLAMRSHGPDGRKMYVLEQPPPVGSTEPDELRPEAAGSAGTVPRPRHMIDDRDLGGSFPFETAWGQAAGARNPLGRFLADHPDAYPARVDPVRSPLAGTADTLSTGRDDASHPIRDVDPPTTYGWAVTVTDGRDAQRFVLHRVGDGPATRTIVTSDGPDPGSYPVPAILPERVVDVRQVADRMAAYFPQVELQPATQWRLEVVCATAACDQADIMIWVGTWYAAYDQVAPSVLAKAWAEADEREWHVQIRVEPDGEVVATRTFSRQMPALLRPDALLGDARAPEPAAPPGFAWGPSEVATLVAASLLVTVLAAVAHALWLPAKAGVGGLVARVERGQALAHPTRARIVAAVEARPGIHLASLQRLLGCSRSTVHHHVDALRAAGLVTMFRQGRRRCLAQPEARETAYRLALLRSHGARGIVDLLSQRGRAPAELRRLLGLSPGTVHYHLRRLEDAGWVRRGGARGRPVYTLDDAMRGVADLDAPPGADSGKQPPVRE